MVRVVWVRPNGPDRFRGLGRYTRKSKLSRVDHVVVTTLRNDRRAHRLRKRTARTGDGVISRGAFLNESLFVSDSRSFHPARIITFTSVITRTKARTVITPQAYYRLFATLAIIKNCRYCAESERVSVFLKS